MYTSLCPDEMACVGGVSVSFFTQQTIYIIVTTPSVDAVWREKKIVLVFVCVENGREKLNKKESWREYEKFFFYVQKVFQICKKTGQIQEEDREIERERHRVG